MTGTERPKGSFSRLMALARMPVCVLFVGLLCSSLYALQQHRANNRLAQERLFRASQEMADTLSRRLYSYEHGLRGMRGVIITAGEHGISRRVVSRYNQSRSIDREFPGVRGFGFIRRVPAGGVDAFVEAARQENPRFAVRTIADNPGERYIIQYIEPVQRNRQAVGLDIASEPHRWLAATRSARSGNPTLTGPITLVQARNVPQRSFLVLLPAYREGLPMATPAQRQKAVFGWAYAPVISDEVIRAIGLNEQDYALSIADIGDGGELDPFYRSPQPDVDIVPGLARSMRRNILGRQWLIEVQARQGFLTDLNLRSPWLSYLYGILSTLLLTALSYMASVNRQRERREFAQRARHSALVENSVDAIIGETPDGRVTSWNPGAERLFGYPADEVLGRHGNELLVPTEHLDEEEHIARSIRQGLPVAPFDSVRRRKDGSLLEVSIAAVPLFDSRGKLTELAKTIRDITSLKAAEHDLRKLNASLEEEVASRTATLKRESERLDYILSGTNVGTWEWNAQTGELHINARWADIVGYTLDELQPLSIDVWNRLVHPDDGRRSQELLCRHFAGEVPFYHTEVRMRHRDGHWVWVLDRGRISTWTADGKPEWMHGTHMDVSQTHGLLERLQASQELLETTSLLVSTGGWEWYLETGDVVWTDGCKRIHEVPMDYVPTLTSALDFYPPEARQKLRKAVEKAVMQGGGYDLELPFINAKGRQLWVRTIGRAETEHGQTIKMIGVIQDISAHRDAENELMRAMQMAEAANAAKSAFLANTSHEIRTPLNAMIGLSHLLQQTALDAEQQNLLAKIQLANRTLLGVVNDVLDLSKIEAGEMSIDNQPLDLCDLLREIADIWRPQAEAKGLTIQVAVPEDCPCLVLGDVLRLRQMLNNLMGNAAKFTEHGGITLACELLEENEERALVRLAVHDTGIGIEADKLPQLFSPFTQADASTTRKYGGTGLGLSIVKQLAGLMGGEVGADSRPGEGSTFWVRLPLRKYAHDRIVAEPHNGTLGILIALADETARDKLADTARALGWRAEVVVDAAAALSRLNDGAQAGQRIDAVLAATPSTAAAAAAARLHQRLPTVLLATQGRHLAPMPENDGVLELPASSSALFNTVHEAIIRRGGDHGRLLQSTPVAATRTLWLPDVRVLLVDDSEINQEVAQRILEREGARVTCAGNGAAALDLLRQTPAAFDLVLMDVQMPVMDGNEATLRIRRELGLHRLPILALTAGALAAERQRTIAAGMNDFISKPIDPNDLIQRVRTHVERARGRALPAVPRTPDAGRHDWPEIAGIDGALAMARVGDWALFRRMLARLLRDATEFSVPPPAPDDSAQWQQLSARLHKLRGNAGLLGATTVHRLAGEAERQSRETQAGPLHESLTALAAALNSLRQAAPVLDSTSTATAGQAAGQAIERETVQRIRALLENQDLEAVALIGAHAEGLRAAIGDSTYASLQEALEELDFGKVLALMPET